MQSALPEDRGGGSTHASGRGRAEAETHTDARHLLSVIRSLLTEWWIDGSIGCGSDSVAGDEDGKARARRVVDAPQSGATSASDAALRRRRPVGARTQPRCRTWPEPPPLFLAPLWLVRASLTQESAGRGARRPSAFLLSGKPATGYEQSRTVTLAHPDACSVAAGVLSGHRRILRGGGQAPPSAPPASRSGTAAAADVRRQRTPRPGPSSRVSCVMNKNMKLVSCQRNNP